MNTYNIVGVLIVTHIFRSIVVFFTLNSAYFTIILQLIQNTKKNSSLFHRRSQTKKTNEEDGTIFSSFSVFVCVSKFQFTAFCLFNVAFFFSSLYQHKHIFGQRKQMNRKNKLNRQSYTCVCTKNHIQWWPLPEKDINDSKSTII